MKKLVALALALVLAFGLSLTALAASIDIGMVTDIGTIDDKSFNQGTWEGVKAFGDANDKTYNYYQPSAQSTDMYLEKIDQAVQDGAKVIVTPGYLFEPPIFQAQDMYPDVHFILIDGYPNNGLSGYDYKANTAENTVGIKYAEEQAGYLAGYAAVVEGYTKLGFMGGMAVPAVVRYGYGFVEGADAAAQVQGLTDLEINYHYTGGFSATPEVQTMAASWYTSGTEVIFACGGAVGNSVMAAAEANNGKVIGVDVDQSSESPTVITSAMKGLSDSVQQMLEAYFNGTFPGGQNLVMDASNNGVALPMATSKFTTFTQADYDALFAKLADGSITIQKDVDASGNAVNLTDLTLAVAKVTSIA